MLGIDPTTDPAQSSPDATATDSPSGTASEPVERVPGRRERREERKREAEAAKVAHEAEKAARKGDKAARTAEEAAEKAAKKAAKNAAKNAAKKGLPPFSDEDSAGVGNGDVVEPVEPVEPVKTIVIGGDDELPDAVYLDDVGEERLRDIHGSAEATRSSGATIVIGDELDSSGAFDAVAVPTRSMDPRVRARRIAVKRAAGRRRLVWVAVAVLVVVLIVGALAVFSSSLFAVEDVRVQGATYTQFYDAPALHAVIADLEGEPILLVDTLDAERRLEQIPWIERAIVATDFPHSVMIDVRERQPLAAFQGTLDKKYRIIDRDGRVLSILDGQPADYMLITGQAPDVERGALAGAPWAAAAQMVAALPAEIRAITTAAAVDAGTGDLGLVLQPAITVRLGGFAGVDAKLARLLQSVRDGLLGIVSIDVSTAEVSVTRG